MSASSIAISALLVLLQFQHTVCVDASQDPSPPPFSFEPSQDWAGDGKRWSTFFVQLGTPWQTVQLLPSITGSYIYTVWDDACRYPNIYSNLSDCRERRGRVFDHTKSSTFSFRPADQYYALPLAPEHYLYGDQAETSEMGTDNITLGWPDLQDWLPLPKMTIFSYYNLDFPVGTFGISNDSAGPSAGTTATNLLGQLWSQKLIPSRSWGYLAGAVYRTNFTTPSPGSLIFGGYDASRLKASTKLQLAAGHDTYRVFLLSIEGITTGDGDSLLEARLDNVALDSQVTHIWLPLSACLLFEQAFGLVWNDTYNMYLVDDAQHADLQNRNLSVTFTLSNGLSDSTDRLNITLPYGAFDMQTTFPLSDGQTHYYFPLNRSANDTQNTLGRTILQEMYMVADYERGNIDLYEAVYPESDVPSDIITICPVDSTTCRAQQSRKKLSTGAIVGVAVGAAVVLCGIFAALWYKWHGRKHSKYMAANKSADGNRDSTVTWVGGVDKPELDASTTTQRSPRSPNELEGFYGGVVKPELDSGYTSPHAPTGSASGGGSSSNPRDSRSLGVPSHEMDGRDADFVVEAGGAEVHELTAWQEQQERTRRAELAGSPGRHELYGSTTWPSRQSG